MSCTKSYNSHFFVHVQSVVLRVSARAAAFPRGRYITGRVQSGSIISCVALPRQKYDFVCCLLYIVCYYWEGDVHLVIVSWAFIIFNSFPLLLRYILGGWLSPDP